MVHTTMVGGGGDDTDASVELASRDSDLFVVKKSLMYLGDIETARQAAVGKQSIVPCLVGTEPFGQKIQLLGAAPSGRADVAHLIVETGETRQIAMPLVVNDW